MTTRICDRCGQLLEEGALRYVAKVSVFAAYDPLKLAFEDLNRDLRADLRRVLEQCEGMTAEELERDVHAEFEFDLCRPCQKAYVRDPLPMAKEEA
jgi:hypothetical protein